MFENIGSKIKGLASFMCWIGIGVSVMGGIILLAYSGEAWYNEEICILLGFATMIGGSLLSWLSSFVLYGFGELIENSAIIAGKTEKRITAQSNGVAAFTEKDRRISNLNDLKARGLITADEYNKKLEDLENGNEK